MSYAKNGFPVEKASKIGQLRIVSDPVVQGLIQSFEADVQAGSSSLIEPTGNIDLSQQSEITRVVAIDGGEALIPNPIRRDRALGFITAAALLVRMDEYEQLASDPMMDPRDVAKSLEKKLWYKPTAIPLSGVSMPGMTVRETIRAVVNSTLSQANTGLNETLQFLVYREWHSSWPDEVKLPHMDCMACGEEFDLPVAERTLNFSCSNCGEQHYLSDYLGVSEVSDDFGREATVSNLRNVLETLMLFDFIRKYQHAPEEIRKTLFIKDGPLLLRAQLSRLIEPIRDYLEHLRRENVNVNIVGVEKNGGMVNLIDEFKNKLKNAGDYFLPSVRFLVEEVSGNQMPENYRNRVSFGAKLAIRLGDRHVVVLHIPTGGFLTEPKLSDLIGFEQSARVLSKLLSHRYDNALVPLVLVNSMASIARKPSGTILQSFADRLIQSSS